MALTSIQAVYFDAVGTLIHPDPPAVAVYAEVGRRFGSGRSPAAIASGFVEAFARTEEVDGVHGLRTSEERERRRWRDIVGWVLDDVGDPTACFEELYHHFSQPAAWRLDAEAPALLEGLAAAGCGLGVASNYDRRLRPVVAGLPGLCRVTNLVISSEVGYRKPAREFFDALPCQAGVPANQILYVGDDWGNDYEGARAAGLRAVLFDPNDTIAGDVSRIRRLGDLTLGLPAHVT